MKNFNEPADPQEKKYTTWCNPMDHATHVDIMEHPGRWTRYKAPAKGKVTIPSEYDYAIQRVENNVIQAGLAPLWYRDGVPEEDRPTVHPALDPAAAEAKMAEDAIMKSVIQKQALEDTMIVAQQRLAKNTVKK